MNARTRIYRLFLEIMQHHGHTLATPEPTEDDGLTDWQTDSLAIRLATVPVSVPFSVHSKICNNFPFLQFLTDLNNPKFCYVMYVIRQIPRICDNCSILSYLPILAYNCIKHSKILDCLDLLRTEELEKKFQILLWTKNGTETGTVATLIASGSVGVWLSK